MTPTLGWLMTVVAVVAVGALAISLRRSRRPSPAQPGFTPIMRKSVDVVVNECDENAFSVEVDPSEVGVPRGGPLRWNFSGPDDARLSIEPKDPASWPFPSPPSPARAAPRVPVQAGNAKGNAPVGSRHRYWVVIECDGRTYRIDPDIYILD
jgi:hypothetical protein